MAKTQEELNQLKTEYEALTTKLQELTEDELNMVVGGIVTIGELFQKGDATLHFSNKFEPGKSVNAGGVSTSQLEYITGK